MQNKHRLVLLLGECDIDDLNKGIRMCLSERNGFPIMIFEKFPSIIIISSDYLLKIVNSV
jgi:hypothetical protein